MERCASRSTKVVARVPKGRPVRGPLRIRWEARSTLCNKLVYIGYRVRWTKCSMPATNHFSAMPRCSARRTESTRARAEKTNAGLYTASKDAYRPRGTRLRTKRYNRAIGTTRPHSASRPPSQVSRSDGVPFPSHVFHHILAVPGPAPPWAFPPGHPKDAGWLVYRTSPSPFRSTSYPVPADVPAVASDGTCLCGPPHRCPSTDVAPPRPRCETRSTLTSRIELPLFSSFELPLLSND